MNFFYSAASMGYGTGRFWHRFFKFPKFPRVTKTLTRFRKRGYPYAVVRIGSTVYNHIAHHNIGILDWIDEYGYDREFCKNVIVSLAGTDQDIAEMIWMLEKYNCHILGVQLSFSCPNVRDLHNKNIPQTKFPVYLKLNYLQDPYKYDLDRVVGINVNSVPCWFGGMSGKDAQKYNWEFIKKFNKEGLDIAGSSFLSAADIAYLVEYCGCKRIGIGSTLLIKPSLIECL